jgi:hypothetical protein
VRAFYFGCVREAGHFWWCAQGYGGRPVQAHGSIEVFLRDLPVDGTFCPPNGQEEGPAQLIYVTAPYGQRVWTLLAFWDRSVDKRGGCCSVYALEGVLTFDQAMSWARKFFPTIWERYSFTVTEWRPAPSDGAPGDEGAKP